MEREREREREREKERKREMNRHREIERYEQTDNEKRRGARGVMVIVEGNGHGDTSSNRGRNWLHFTYH